MAFFVSVLFNGKTVIHRGINLTWYLNHLYTKTGLESVSPNKGFRLLFILGRIKNVNAIFGRRCLANGIEVVHFLLHTFLHYFLGVKLKFCETWVRFP